MTTVTILQNHGHALAIPQEDIDAAVPKDYNIQGDANHGHMVSMTADDFAQLDGGDDIQKQADFRSAHAHAVLIVGE